MDPWELFRVILRKVERAIQMRTSISVALFILVYLNLIVTVKKMGISLNNGVFQW